MTTLQIPAAPIHAYLVGADWPRHKARRRNALARARHRAREARRALRRGETPEETP